MFKMRVRCRTAFALCVWALSASWIPSSAMAGIECGSGALVVTQHAPWGGKSSTRKGAAQVVVWTMVTAGELRAGEPENGLDAGRRCPLRQQVACDPQIDDAPIGLRKAVGDAPALHTATVDGAGLRHGDVRERSMVAGRRSSRGGPGRQRPQWRGSSGRLQQRVGLRGQTSTGVHQSDPGSIAAGSAPRGLLIGETGESSQMAPVGARRIATVGTRQPLARSRRHDWFQRTGAETDPGLKMARAGLQNHTRGMPMGAHGLQHRWLRSVEIDENIACVLAPGVGVDINIASLAVAGAQKPDCAGAHQLPGAPQPLSRESASALSVNQTDQVKFVRHRRQLFGNSLPGQKESPVVHGSRPPLPGSLCNDKSSSAQQSSADRSCLIDTVSQKGPQSTKLNLSRLLSERTRALKAPGRVRRHRAANLRYRSGMSSLRWILAGCLLAGGAGRASCQEAKSAAPATPAAESKPADKEAPLPADAHASQTSNWKARRSRIPLRWGPSRCSTRTVKKSGEVVYTAYTMEGPDRAVTFALNGGPGAASVYLNFGAIGPKHLKFGDEGDSPSDPATLSDNPGTWLDFTDLVFIDPIGTGFSRSLVSADETKKQFYTTDADIHYLSRSHLRLAGEERPHGVAQVLCGRKLRRLSRAADHPLPANHLGVAMNGVVLVSPYLNPTLDQNGDVSPMPWLLTLPSISAAHLERIHKLTPEAMAAVIAYTRGEYATDLLKGRSDPDATPRIVKRVTEMTGLEEEFVRRAGGRLEIGAYLREVFRESGKIGSVYDSNVTSLRSFPVRSATAHERSAAREHHRADDDGHGRFRHARGGLEDRRAL